MTTKFKDSRNTAWSMKSHEYKNAKVVEIDGLMRVMNKHGEVMPMVSSQRKVKGRAW
ncbi:hypothetical protein [Jeotgalibaca porci]|uniref:hypothetical protein n=1 Tax=Jeotgalibaca porci TaxID=1868793 RepID=UPI0035A0894D